MKPASKIFNPWQSDGAAAMSRWPAKEQLLPLPPTVAEQTPTTLPALDVVNQFVDRLLDLPLSTWLAIGRDLMADRDALAVRQRAWTELESAIASAGLGILAWYTRDAVETVVCLVSRDRACWSREDRCRCAATHGAAEAAALGLLGRAHISADTLRVLCAPFAREIELPLARSLSS